jgi:hypothetical protein
LEEHPKAADLYARKKKAFLILDYHIWYSMNKKPFVDEVNMYALLDVFIILPLPFPTDRPGSIIDS